MVPFFPKTAEIPFDEKWPFVGTKQKNCDPELLEVLGDLPIGIGSRSEIVHLPDGLLLIVSNLVGASKRVKTPDILEVLHFQPTPVAPHHLRARVSTGVSPKVLMLFSTVLVLVCTVRFAKGAAEHREPLVKLLLI
ncbi:hypothetical protein J8F10_24700 [Gemmata sp. G18]|uniref:Uncharacterized protein n=1 Tax=Gemmata palustris TaxID=2822762 RepID=A0ABS5BYX7_9BACT|nr:hypothetical protein [Gemmata palustris]MBP3958460.1 hypothetical protein [Gemmata palustris]